jgi:hypothetical protein
MKYILPIAVIGIMLLQLSGAIPRSSVGGALTIAVAIFAAALAVGIHEAWTQKRGVLGWIVNIVISLVGVFVATSVGEIVMVVLLSPFMGGASLFASAAGPQFAIALAGHMAITLLVVWGAIWLVNRWR